ncbi:MAG: STAS domain-containing protein [Bacillati bacterium ANGP1]|uniref:STAS domain-containing protein n=1 Tax=Candidatus Segetimicrobium genomatis TaxID=2569760 RepID=A0A537KQ43_9BACT|nr:MAG: STAS domain-containing protein [Terrabacteria group bacterium ANGP1]
MTDPLAAVRVILKGDVVVASLEGEVDLSNAHDIREDILASIPNTAAGLILDLTKTVYLDSQGIQVLLDVTELLGVRQQRIRLIVPTAALIRQVLSLTSLASVLSLDPTMEDALANLQATDL